MSPLDETLVVGRHAVAAALAGRPELAQELLVAGGEKTPAVQAILQAARAAGVKVRRVEAASLERLSGSAVHQGVALRLAAAGYAQAEDIIAAAAAAGPAGLVLVADHIQDPQNLGALIRSAAAAGAQGLIMPKDRACPLTPVVTKAAAGALAYLPVARVTNLSRALDRLKQAGLWVLAAATRGAPPPWELDLRLPLALVLGGEHKGVGQRLLAAADLTASIPLAPGVESLNVSVAAGVLLFEVVRQRAGMDPSSK
ncbi:MAG: 23S rRNA (guanosine(2251)-2'-O)-methyltransferase RlmB [Desulfarculus sp.]|nr:MAG: 23S rRNA (guanosine(2251)-2'-O)-methyltransferase RlmB [Desulfarculus sp.]